MGGRAFVSRPNAPNIVRLPSEQYISLRDRYQSTLLRFYKRAAVPPEAPEKRDHGDIDVVVDGPLFKFTTQDLAKELGAIDHTRNGRTSSFAIQVPEDSGCFFQLDVQYPKPGCFEWESITHSYGDLWRIIGITVTHFGLTINDSGLHARIEEIEAAHKKGSLLLLTSDPLDMMSFLNLDSLRYEKGFSTLDEVFEWATAMPLFHTRFFEKGSTSKKKGQVKEKRPMYSKFVTEWLPQQPNLHTKGSSGHSRIDERRALLSKALLRFNKGEEHQKMLVAHRERPSPDAMWGKIGSTLPLQGKDLGQAIAALKSHVRWDDGQPRLKVERKSPMEKVPPMNAEKMDTVLLPWIKEHWSEAVRLYEESRPLVSTRTSGHNTVAGSKA